jgi:hypothetical protein
MPSREEVLQVSQEQHTRTEMPLRVANLDGLLTALFTRPNLEHNCSIYAMLDRHRLDSTAFERSIAGVRDVCTKDPSLGYASRQPYSDGRISRKVNLTMRCPRFATLLAFLGAMRFLRAQPIAGDFIIFSTPAPSSLSLHAESARPLLRPRYHDGLEQALMLQALELVTDHSQDDKQWKALSYQVLLSRGKQQAISLSRGVLDLVRFEHLKHRLGEHLLRYWKVLLSMSQGDSPSDLHNLIEALTTARMQDWEAHLFDVAEAEFAQNPLGDRNHRENAFAFTVFLKFRRFPHVPRKKRLSQVEDEQSVELDQGKGQHSPDETADANIVDV